MFAVSCQRSAASGLAQVSGTSQCCLNLLAHRQKFRGPTNAKAHPMPIRDRGPVTNEAPGDQRTRTLKKKYYLQKKLQKHRICCCSFCLGSLHARKHITNCAGACTQQEYSSKFKVYGCFDCLNCKRPTGNTACTGFAYVAGHTYIWGFFPRGALRGASLPVDFPQSVASTSPKTGVELIWSGCVACKR